MFHMPDCRASSRLFQWDKLVALGLLVISLPGLILISILLLPEQRGNMLTDDHMARRLERDLRYIRERGGWTDTKILLRTIFLGRFIAPQ
jgi:lipopolysaccharide/colanic/teichoic acid biosynthesis glycosyltransferase